MRLRQLLILALAACLLVLSCGSKPKSFDVSERRQVGTRMLEEPEHFVSVQSAANAALFTRALETVTWLAASIPENSPTLRGSSGAVDAPVLPASTAAASPSVWDWDWDSSLAPCDGDLPPCWRIIGTESGGRWDAHNYDGCYDGGINYQCWGPYQFGGFWAGKLGLPLDLWTTTHEQWVNAARELWANGAGCSNWSAC